MATSVKKERSRRTSWLSPMWRDIDSLRKQNESTKKEIESMRRKSKQTEIETEQLKSETEILRRQNKALALIESSDLDALLKEVIIPGRNDSKHPEAQLDPELLANKLKGLGCDANDIPFLLDVLEVTKQQELFAPRKLSLSASACQGQASRSNNSCGKLDRRRLRSFPGTRTKNEPATFLTINTNSRPRYGSRSRPHEAPIETQWLRRAGQRRDPSISR
jgi:hypothetical protein